MALDSQATDYRAFARIYPRFSNKRAARWPQEGLRSGLRESCERSYVAGRKRGYDKGRERVAKEKAW